MSGPKLIEMRRRARAARLQKNRDLCDRCDAEYGRLCAEHARLRERLIELGANPGKALEDPATLSALFRDQIEQGHDEEAGRRYPHQVESALSAVEDARLALGGRRAALHHRLQLARAEAERLAAEDPGGANESLVASLAALAEEDHQSLARFEESLQERRARLDQDRARSHPQVTLVPGKLPGQHAPLTGRSLADFVARKKAAAPTPAANKPPFRTQFDRLLHEGAALGDPDLWQDLQRRERQIEEAARQQPDDPRLQTWLREATAAVEEARNKAAFRRAIQHMIDRTAMFQSAEVRAFVGELQALLAGNHLVPLGPWRQRLEAVLEQADRQREHEARRQAILESLRELGYRPNEGMQTALAQGGRLLLQTPGQEDYAVELVADPALDRIQTSIVRFAADAASSEAQRLRDREEEERWCGDHGQLRDKLAERGWESAFLMQRPAGEHPVRVIIDANRTTRPRSTGASSTRPRARSKGG